MKVSVSLLAYNHEAYIEQSVRSALAQRTNFDFEIVVGEDCSTDRTLEILRALQREHPDKIRLLTTDHNLGMIQNSIRSFQACQGEYIALLDGDDYWTAEDKLQKQVDFLDQRPDFAISFHSVLRIYEDGSRPPKVMRPDKVGTVFTLEDLMSTNFIPTCSVVLRNGSIDEFPEWTYSLNMLDWLMFVIAARHGKIGFIDEVMAVYRVHGAGIWSSMELLERQTASIDLFERLDPYLEYRYTEAIRANLNESWSRLMNELYDQAIALGSIEAARGYLDAAWASLKQHDSIPPYWKKELYDRVYSHYMITSYQSGNYPGAWTAWRGMIKNNPRHIRNRGLVLMGVESTFNGRWRPFIRRFARSQRSKDE